MGAQGYLPILLAEIRAAFPPGALYTPPEHAARPGSSNYTWPSMNQLVSEGKRLLVASGEDYGADMAQLIFARPAICGWQARMLVPARSVACLRMHYLMSALSYELSTDIPERLAFSTAPLFARLST